jgi:catechol 2,3-dioxygenase-like lactoylglutathione lyase family enzyme
MQQQIAVITLGVSDLDRSRIFYAEGFGRHRADEPAPGAARAAGTSLSIELLLSGAAAVCSTVSFAPQAVKIIRTRNGRHRTGP